MFGPCMFVSYIGGKAGCPGCKAGEGAAWLRDFSVSISGLVRLTDGLVYCGISEKHNTKTRYHLEGYKGKIKSTMSVTRRDSTARHVKATTCHMAILTSG